MKLSFIAACDTLKLKLTFQKRSERRDRFVRFEFHPMKFSKFRSDRSWKWIFRAETRSTSFRLYRTGLTVILSNHAGSRWAEIGNRWRRDCHLPWSILNYAPPPVPQPRLILALSSQIHVSRVWIFLQVGFELSGESFQEAREIWEN